MTAQYPVSPPPPQSPPHTGKKLLKGINQTFPAVRYFTRKQGSVPDILSMIVVFQALRFQMPSAPIGAQGPWLV